MTTSDSDINKISAELKHLSLKRQQLLERKKIQCIVLELRARTENGQTEEAVSNQQEIDRIDAQLKQVLKKKAELQNMHDNLLNARDTHDKKKKVSFISSLKIDPKVVDPASSVIYVEAPPSIPAPTVILDLEKLPAFPCKTQCPECRQFVVTETFTSVTCLTWLVCFMTAMIGCIAGCCLIPFCIDKFKSTTHRCPKCRSTIQVVKTL